MKTKLVLNAQYLSADDAKTVRALASSVDRSLQNVPGYSTDFLFDSVPAGWAGTTERVVSYGPNEGCRIWDARKA